MKKLICLILLIITTASFLINRNIQQGRVKKKNSDMQYLLSVKDSSNDRQYKEIVYYDDTNSVKINDKKVDNPIQSLNKNIKNSKSVNYMVTTYSSSYTKSDYNSNTNEINQNEGGYGDSDDVELLAHLIESEAGNEPMAGKIAVGDVVINRMKTDRKDMKDIVYAKSQFDGVETSNFSIQPGADSLEAARKVLSGFNLVPDAYFFANLKLCDPNFALKSKFIIRIGDHWFFRK